MRISIIGGRLQGTEAAYLARKAGWEVVLLDKKPDVPASGLADAFYCQDVTSISPELKKILQGSDFILPALEDEVALEFLQTLSLQVDIPLAFDGAAYPISQSKKKSNALFERLRLPVPKSWPHSSFPLIAKPCALSGSRGVKKIFREKDLSPYLASDSMANVDWIIQEFCEGPSFSLEVVGLRGKVFPLQTTLIEVDSQYDCKRVSAPPDLPKSLDEEFRRIASKIGSAVRLSGLMDVEVIFNKGLFKVLEIDARLPSQTPSVVYHSSGINMLELLHEIFVHNSLPEIPERREEKGVVYEHIRVTPRSLKTCGEHIMSQARPLHHYDGFFGADEALTDYDPHRSHWVATLILKGKDLFEAWSKRCEVIRNIQKELGLFSCRDSHPM